MQRSVAVELLELAADEPLANLLSAAADVVEFGIAPKAPTWVLVNVAIAAKELDALF